MTVSCQVVKTTHLCSAKFWPTPPVSKRETNRQEKWGVGRVVGRVQRPPWQML